ncbi:YwqG family protein [Paenibacillus campi]|uniref:YwqG family protein n=1 Tax=Paenibacillus campi TaxID=3106031 RepID=UPI002AFFD0D6|nr:YwqG family protein [Paenibacillus sp. SGZ-1009]
MHTYSNYPNLLPEAKLKQLLDNYEAPELENYLRNHQRPVVKLIRGNKGHQRIGHSRFGGNPDLPPQLTWPQTKNGDTMTLIAQLNLAQLHAEIQDEAYQGVHRSLLPQQGMLYFFAGEGETAQNIEHQVLYWQGTDVSELQYEQQEGFTIWEEEDEMKFEAYEVHAHADVEFPNYGYSTLHLVEQSTLTDESEEAYLLITEEMDWKPENKVGQLFGYAEGQHGDDELIATCFWYNGKYSYRPDDDRKRLLKHFDGDEARLQQELDDVLMLLEVDSDQKIGFVWWDAGYMHFFIRKQDLLAGRFDRTFCSIYSS